MKMPGTKQLADRVIAGLVIPDRATARHARLCNRDWNVLHTVAQVPQGTRFLSWQGRVFQHWAGTAWREIHPVRVDGEGSDG